MPCQLHRASCPAIATAALTQRGPTAQVFCAEHSQYMEHVVPLLPPDRKPVFLDGGANFGGASIIYAFMTAFNAHIVAVEASPRTFELTKRNLAAIECAPLPRAPCTASHCCNLWNDIL